MNAHRQPDSSPDRSDLLARNRNRRSRFMSLPDLAVAIDRDRREPDKIMGYALDLDHIAHELAEILDWAQRPEGDAYLRRTDALSLLRSIVGEPGGVGE